jgi:ADP-heptose:LPS heptosyltransferase
MLDTYTQVQRINFICQDHCIELVKHLLWRYERRLNIVSYDQMKDVIKEGVPGIMTDNTHHTTLRSHITDHAFHSLCDWMPPDNSYKHYIQLDTTNIDVSQFNLPKQYVVITTGFTSNTREWLPGEINKTVAGIKDMGYEVVFLGQHQSKYKTDQKPVEGTFREEIDYSQGLCLIDKTTLLEAGAIIAEAAVVAGVDNGLLHLAGCTNTPIVAGYTTVPARFRMPYRFGKLGWNCFIIEPTEDLGCRGCQEKLNLTFGFDLRTCYYGDYQCVTHMTADRFIEELAKCLP